MLVQTQNWLCVALLLLTPTIVKLNVPLSLVCKAAKESGSLPNSRRGRD